jgi:hypothetical protein
MTEAARPLAEPGRPGPDLHPGPGLRSGVDPRPGVRGTAGIGVRGGAPRQAGGPFLTVVARRPVAASAGPRRPMHVAVAIGVTAGVYAISLAGVTGLQAASNAQLAADRAPAIDAVAQLKASHDALDAGLSKLDGAYTDAASRYSAITDQIAGHENDLSQLGSQVKAAEGSASTLTVPTVSRLPAVSTTRTTYVSKPAAHACTTASGKPC